MQQGGSPSPFDRNMGTKMAIKAAFQRLLPARLRQNNNKKSILPNKCTLKVVEKLEVVSILGMQIKRYFKMLFLDENGILKCSFWLKKQF